MAETTSTMLPLGTLAPEFTLPDVCSGELRSLADLKSTVATVIMFICNHCPYVKHIQSHLAKVAKEYQAKGINFIAINSNDVKNYPSDSPEKMKLEAEAHHYTFPYLFDESQEIAKAYKAACTPDFYIFDPEMKCIYRGRFDSATPGNDDPVTGADLIGALESILNGIPVDPIQKPSLGCNIKWRKD